MAGGTPVHAQLSARVVSRLDGLVGGGPRATFSSDLKLYIPAAGHARYADATVICGPPEPSEPDANAVVNPTVIVEVSSEGTEEIDRDEKLGEYKTLPSLQVYAIVSSDAEVVDVYRRSADGWRYERLAAGEALGLGSLGSIPVSDIYAGINLVPKRRKRRVIVLDDE